MNKTTSVLVNIFIDHPVDSRRSFVASVAQEFAHPMINYLDNTLPMNWKLSMDCWCDEICQGS